jgi:beta-barrel assembly-enhancing protease
VNRVRIAAFFCGLLLSVSAIAAVEQPTGSPSAAGYLPVGKDEQGLWAQMDEIEREFKASKLIVRNESVSQYLRSVLCRVVGDNKCGAARIYVVRSTAFNASMAPNGMMTVNTGLLLRTRNEAELAAILGHEFGHFEMRHSLSSHKSARNASGWSTWLTVLSIGVGAATDFSPLFIGGYFKFSRDQERAADYAGIGYMGARGYRTIAASNVWAQLRDEEDARALALGVKSLKDSGGGPFASHPMSIERMTYLREAARTIGSANDFDGRAEYRKAISPLWQMLIDDQIKMNEFGRSEFLLNRLADGDWSADLLVARGDLYRSRGKLGDFEQAAAFYREASLKPEAPTVALRGLGLSLLRAGDALNGKAALSEYLRLKPDAPDRAMLLMIGEQK